MCLCCVVVCLFMYVCVVYFVCVYVYMCVYVCMFCMCRNLQRLVHVFDNGLERAASDPLAFLFGWISVVPGFGWSGIDSLGLVLEGERERVLLNPITISY